MASGKNSKVSKDALHNSFEDANSNVPPLPRFENNPSSPLNLNPLPSLRFCSTLFFGSAGNFLASPPGNLKLPSDFYTMFRDNLKFFIGRDMVVPIQGRSDDQEVLNKFKDQQLLIIWMKKSVKNAIRQNL